VRVGSDVQTNFANGVYIWIESAPSGVGGEGSDGWGFGRVVCSASMISLTVNRIRAYRFKFSRKLTSAEFQCKL